MTAPTQRTPRAPLWWPRILASLVDYLVIVAWLLTLGGLSLIITPFLPPASGQLNLAATDLIVFAMTVLPVWLYLTLTEAGPAGATLGKRVARLSVRGAQDSRASGRQVALRNAVKLLPWQLAHLAVSRFILGVQFEVAIACDVISVALVAVTLLMAIVDPGRRALHDRMAGTRVVTQVADRTA
jgi:uncharacterized RDD family membrane protein YckC